MPEAEQVIAGRGGFPGRQRDEEEVRNFYLAVDKAEAIAALKRPLKKQDIQLLHRLAFEGKSKPSPYRDGQNVIRNSADGNIVDLPPEATEVPALMQELIAWINNSIQEKSLPVPLIAALAHYQFATIHSYYDANGRTSRLLATIILHCCGYGPKGICSLEEYYAQNLRGDYDALSVGPNHNSHFERAEVDVSGFVQYFCKGMADAFNNIRAETVGSSVRGDMGTLLRELCPLQRQKIGLFAKSQVVTAGELAESLGLGARQGRDLCAKWIEEGFLVIENASKKARSDRLAKRYEEVLVRQ